MKKLVLFAALTAMGLATTAIAEVVVEDADENGAISYAELVVAYPDLTEEAYAALDTDESGELSMEELKAAMESGALGA